MIKKSKRLRKLTASLLTGAMLITMLPGMALGATPETGTPYNNEGTYDVNTPHVLVNQVYGGKDDGNADHSFIELYNPCDETIDLNGWEIQYRSSEDGAHSDSWQELALTGTIPAEGYYLIRCGTTTGSDYQVPAGDQEWDLELHNKGLSVALFSQDVTLTETFSGAITNENRPEGYVDLLATQGNDKEDNQIPPAYEGEYDQEQSKKKAIRRMNFADTDNNKNDIEIIDYSETVNATKGPHGQTGSPEPEEPEPATPIYRNNSFESDAALTMNRLNSINIGTANADGGVAEIVAYNADTREAYVINGQDGLLYLFDVTENGLEEKGNKDMRAIVDSFTYGDMTSVAVDTVNNSIAVALQAADYDANGRVVLLDYHFTVKGIYEVGVQPDMVTFSPDGKYVLSANEGEPRNGYTMGNTDPAGTISIIDTTTESTDPISVNTVGFENFDAETLAADGVLIGKVDGILNTAANDLEPEYIVVSPDSDKAYVALQEANAIATVDLTEKTITSIKSLGFKDLSQEENAIDLLEDNQYKATAYQDTLGAYMPDGLSIFETNGTTYLVTANEGDSREWGDYSNEAKENLTSTDGETTAEDVRVLDKDCTSVPDDSKNYLFGGRSFCLYNADTMELVYESANEFETQTASYLPDYFNCSNDDIERDSRSAKKGPEPETVTTGTINGKTYAFIALERISGVMVYDVSDPADVTYVNYINTRDYSADIKEDVSPEGLCFLTLDSKPMLLAACEVSGTVAAYECVAKTSESGNQGNHGSPAPEKYTITMTEATGGTYSVNKNAAADTRVLITAKPDQGYSVSSVTVTTADGDTIPVTAAGDDRYTFTMPAERVTVQVIFNAQSQTLPFTDLAENAWYLPAVNYVYQNGLMEGTAADTFSPNATTSRGMIVTILYRLEKEPAVAGENPFSDVADGAYYKDAITWAATENIVTGYSTDTFLPNGEISREELATILHRYVMYKDLDNTTDSTDALQRYTDIDEIASYAVPAFQWALASGVMEGTSDTTLEPQATATRAEAATMLMRLCENI